jgi:hypothetical protein
MVINKSFLIALGIFIIALGVNIILPNEEAIVAICFLLFFVFMYDMLRNVITSVLNETSYKLYKQFKAYNNSFLNGKFVLDTYLTKNLLPLQQLFAIYQATTLVKNRLFLKFILILINNLILNILEVYKSVKTKFSFTKNTINAILVEHLANKLRNNDILAQQFNQDLD